MRLYKFRSDKVTQCYNSIGHMVHLWRCENFEPLQKLEKKKDICKAHLNLTRARPKTFDHINDTHTITFNDNLGDLHRLCYNNDYRRRLLLRCVVVISSISGCTKCQERHSSSPSIRPSRSHGFRLETDNICDILLGKIGCNP